MSLGIVGVSSRNFLGDVARGWGDNVGLEGPPPQIWEGKKLQNSARFLTTFDFDREYIRNGLRSKIGKEPNQLQPFHVGRKKGELWSTNTKVLGLTLSNPKCAFSVS